MMNTSELDLHKRALEITTAKACPVLCEPLCPQMKFRELYGDKERYLQYEDFELALSKTPKDVLIVFAGFAEPFINKRAIDMVELAHQRGYTVTLSSTLVGINPLDVERLKILDWFSLHAPDNKGIAHIPPTQNFKDSLYNVFTKLNIDEISRMDKGFFAEDRAGNAEFSDHKRNVKGPFWCSKLVRPQPVLLPNMDLYLCCMDWNLQHKLGNLRNNTYEEIVNGDVFKIISGARFHMSGSELCRSCSNAWSYPKAAAIEVGWKSYKRLYKWARRSSGI